MARNLHKAGLLRAVWNRSNHKARTLATELGVAAADSLQDFARQVDVVVICVSADADVRSVIEGLAPGLARGTLLIDCSTVSADTARWASGFLASRGVRFIDAPVSGGVEGAKNAALAIMCGGERADFDEARPVLAAMGKTIEHFGPSGSGQATKATNQIMCAGIIRACAEAMAFAGAHQLPLDRVIATLGAGAGSSWYFVHRAPNMMRESYPPDSASSCTPRISASAATWPRGSACSCPWSSPCWRNTRNSLRRATATKTSPLRTG